MSKRYVEHFSFTSWLTEAFDFLQSVVASGRLKTIIANFKSPALRVGAVAYERWLLRSDFTGEVWVLWKSGRQGDVLP